MIIFKPFYKFFYTSLNICFWFKINFFFFFFKSAEVLIISPNCFSRFLILAFFPIFFSSTLRYFIKLSDLLFPILSTLKGQLLDDGSGFLLDQFLFFLTILIVDLYTPSTISST